MPRMPRRPRRPRTRDEAKAGARPARAFKPRRETGPHGVGGKPRGRPKRSPASAQVRREQILLAALAVFAEHGFEAARTEEIAKRAGIAKGTLYLYFPDKQAMFEALIRSAAAPIVADLVALGERTDLPIREFFERAFTLFRDEVLGTERKLIVRLLISEGARFPGIAAFYHREVLSRVLGAVKQIARRAHARGELAGDQIVRFPQLVAAPLLLSVVWDGLFHKLDPLDVDGLLAAHAELLTRGGVECP